MLDLAQRLGFTSERQTEDSDAVELRLPLSGRGIASHLAHRSSIIGPRQGEVGRPGP